MYIGQLEKEKISWKKFSLAGLKLNIQKTKIMASDPTISWQINGEKVETVADFIFLGSKLTADQDCSCGIKKQNKTKHFLLQRKAMNNFKKTRFQKAETLLFQQRSV